jgi:hypothetical protein
MMHQQLIGYFKMKCLLIQEQAKEKCYLYWNIHEILSAYKCLKMLEIHPFDESGKNLFEAIEQYSQDRSEDIKIVDQNEKKGVFYTALKADDKSVYEAIEKYDVSRSRLWIYKEQTIINES